MRRRNLLKMLIPYSRSSRRSPFKRGKKVYELASSRLQFFISI
jgi:hypothetical protein